MIFRRRVSMYNSVSYYDFCKIGDIVTVDYQVIPIENWNNLADPLGIVVIPPSHTPDGKLRLFNPNMHRVTSVGTNNNLSGYNSNYSLSKGLGNIINSALTTSNTWSSASSDDIYLPVDRYINYSTYIRYIITNDDYPGFYYGGLYDNNAEPITDLYGNRNPNLNGYLLEMDGEEKTLLILDYVDTLQNPQNAITPLLKLYNLNSNIKYYIPAIGELVYYFTFYFKLLESAVQVFNININSGGLALDYLNILSSSCYSDESFLLTFICDGIYSDKNHVGESRSKTHHEMLFTKF